MNTALTTHGFASITGPLSSKLKGGWRTSLLQNVRSVHQASSFHCTAALGFVHVEHVTYCSTHGESTLNASNPRGCDPSAIHMQNPFWNLDINRDLRQQVSCESEKRLSIRRRRCWISVHICRSRMMRTRKISPPQNLSAMSMPCTLKQDLPYPVGRKLPFMPSVSLFFVFGHGPRIVHTLSYNRILKCSSPSSTGVRLPSTGREERTTCNIRVRRCPRYCAGLPLRKHT